MLLSQVGKVGKVQKISGFIFDDKSEVKFCIWQLDFDAVNIYYASKTVRG